MSNQDTDNKIAFYTKLYPWILTALLAGNVYFFQRFASDFEIMKRDTQELKLEVGILKALFNEYREKNKK